MVPLKSRTNVFTRRTAVVIAPRRKRKLIKGAITAKAELNFFDTSVTQALANNTPVQTILNPIVEGDTASTRNGNLVMINSAYVDVNAATNGVQGQFVRVRNVLVWDNAPIVTTGIQAFDGALTSQAPFLTPATGLRLFALPNPNNAERYTILRDWIFTGTQGAQSPSGNMPQTKIYRKIQTPAKYNDATASHAKGVLSLYQVSDDGAGNIFTTNTRIRFQDM